MGPCPWAYTEIVSIPTLGLLLVAGVLAIVVANALVACLNAPRLRS